VYGASLVPLEFSSEHVHETVQKTETGIQTHLPVPTTTDQVTPMEQVDQHLNKIQSDILYDYITNKAILFNG